MKPFRGSPMLLEQSHRSLVWPTSPHVTWPHHPLASHLTPWAEVHFKNLNKLLSSFWPLHTPGFFHSSLASPAQISGLWLNLPSLNGSSLTTQCKLGASGFTSFLPCFFKHLPQFCYYIFICAFIFLRTVCLFPLSFIEDRITYILLIMEYLVLAEPWQVVGFK